MLKRTMLIKPTDAKVMEITRSSPGASWDRSMGL